MDPYVQIGTNQSQGHHLLVFLSILIFINLKFKFLILSFLSKFILHHLFKRIHI